jgi:hypothetical protein
LWSSARRKGRPGVLRHRELAGSFASVRAVDEVDFEGMHAVEANNPDRELLGEGQTNRDPDRSDTRMAVAVAERSRRRRLRDAAKRDDRQVSPLRLMFDPQVKDDSRLTADERLRRSAAGTARPVGSELEAWRSPASVEGKCTGKSETGHQRPPKGSHGEVRPEAAYPY